MTAVTSEPQALEESWAALAWLRAIADRRPLLSDVVAAVGLDLLLIIPLIGRENRWWVWLIGQALVLPLCFRRRWPFAVFVVCSGAAFVQWLTDVPLIADAALLVGLYTVAFHSSRRKAMVAAAILEIGVVLASIRFSPADENLLYSLIFLTGTVLAALFIGTNMRTRQAYLASIMERARQLEIDRAQAAELATTRERNRIAHEMHDIIGHSLSVMIALADGAALLNRTDPDQATDAIATVSRTGREAMRETRRLLDILRDVDEPVSRSPQPGLDQLTELADRVALVGPAVEFAVHGTPVALTATEDATAYRIVQESLTNVVKHANGATKVRVQLDWTDESLHLQIADDGREPTVRDTGHGLAGMSERASLFSGSVTAGPRRGGGWLVDVLLPINRASGMTA